MLTVETVGEIPIELPSTYDVAMLHALRGSRIVFVFSSLELGGAERQAIHLGAYLQGRVGSDVEVWAFAPPGQAAALCDEKGIRHRSLEPPLRGSPAAKALGLIRFVAQLRRARVDVLLPYTMGPNVICGLTWRLGGAKLCVWNQRDEGRKRVGGWPERRAVRQTPLFISNSRHAGDFLTGTLAADPRRVHVVKNGVHLPPATTPREAWRQENGISDDDFVAVMVANLHRFKDHATLLHAWRRVASELTAMGQSATLLLAGRPEDTAEPLKALAVELGIGDSVRFPGVVTDVSSLLNAVDLGVLSSRLEGCPNAVLEYMGAGLAVVATDIPGVREALGDDADFLSPPGDSDIMAEAILRLARDPVRRGSAGSANSERVERVFGVERMCIETASLIVNALHVQLDARLGVHWT